MGNPYRVDNIFKTKIRNESDIRKLLGYMAECHTSGIDEIYIIDYGVGGFKFGVIQFFDKYDPEYNRARGKFLFQEVGGNHIQTELEGMVRHLLQLEKIKAHNAILVRTELHEVMAVREELHIKKTYIKGAPIYRFVWKSANPE